MSSLFPHPAPQVGQDIGNFVAGAGDYNQAIPYVFGCAFVPEFRLWQQERADARDTSSGGKGGGGGGKGASQTAYSGSFVSGFCQGPIPMFGTQVAIRRVFAEAAILADFSERKTWLPTPETPDQENDRLDAARTFMQRASFYNGVGTGQLADPVQAGGSWPSGFFYDMFRAVGLIPPTLPGSLPIAIPGYQGIAYGAFRNLDWPSGRPPTITVEICQSAVLTGVDQIIRQSCAVSTIFKTLLMDSGISESDIDVSGLTGAEQVKGIVISPDNKQDAFDNLMRFFDLDCVESNGVIRFFHIDRPVVVSIPFSDIGTTEQNNDSEPFKIKGMKPEDIPSRVVVVGKNFDNDYTKLPGDYTNPASSNTSVVTHDMGDFVATITDLKQAAQRQMFRIRAERFTVESVELPSHYGDLEGGDVVEIQDSDATYSTVRIKSVERGAANGIIKLSVVRHSVPQAGTLVGSSVGGVSTIVAGTTTWAFLNIPPIKDDQADSPGAVIVATGSSPSWASGRILQSKDGGANYTEVGMIVSPATIASCSGVLPSGSTLTWDTSSSLTVVVPNGQLINATDQQLFSGANMVCFSNGEIAQFAIATLVAPQTYTLQRWLRGRRATESKVGTHTSGETMYLLTDITGNLANGVKFIPCNYSDIGRVDNWKIVPFGRFNADEPAVAYAFTGQNMMPFSPCNVQTVVETTSGYPDVTFLFYRRDRKGFELMDGRETPLSEVPERYHFRLKNSSGVVVREGDLSSAIYQYSHTLRNADTGSPSTHLTGWTIEFAQVSPNMGIGEYVSFALTQQNSG